MSTSAKTHSTNPPDPAEIRDWLMSSTALDMNLLRVFAAVYMERSVGRASERLGVSQPAVSNAVTRLRLLLKDQLFVRSPGGVSPTPLASVIAPVIQESLQAINDVLTQTSSFDPQKSTRHFRIHLSDIGELIFLPILQSKLKSLAPNIGITAVAVKHNDIARSLEDGRIDMAFGTLSVIIDPGVRREHLFDEDNVVLIRGGHPLAKEPVNTALFSLFEYLVVGNYPDVERIFLDLRLHDRIAMRISHFLAIPHLIAGSDMAIWIPRRVAQAFVRLSGKGEGFRIIEAKRQQQLFSVFALRHQRSERDQAVNWAWTQALSCLSAK